MGTITVTQWHDHEGFIALQCYKPFTTPQPFMKAARRADETDTRQLTALGGLSVLSLNATAADAQQPAARPKPSCLALAGTGCVGQGGGDDGAGVGGVDYVVDLKE